MKKLKPIQWKPGMVIDKPGLYEGIPIGVYHSQTICKGPSISSSGLRKINPDLGSPAHFYCDWDGNPNRPPQDDAKHFALGRALHHLMLGEREFAKQYIKQPAELPHYKTGEIRVWHGNNTECKEWLVKTRANGRTPLTAQMVEQLKRMSISVGNHPLVKMKDGGLLNGLVECSLIWRDEETGVWLKARPDSIPTSDGDFCDLKSTRSTLYPDLSRTLRDYAYYQQAALVEVGCKIVLDMEMTSFTLLFVESEEPYCNMDYRVDPEDLKRGRRMNRACLRTFAKCYAEKKWPGPGAGNEGNARLQLSGAAREQIDARLKHEGLADGED